MTTSTDRPRSPIRAQPPIGEDPVFIPVTMTQIRRTAKHDPASAAELYEAFWAQNSGFEYVPSEEDRR